MTVMAILQEVDKCVRCNGCVIACKREWNLKLPTSVASLVANPARTVDVNQRLAIKSQRRGDMGPFVRFTCWHCPAPPCAAACPLHAIVKMPNGAVTVDNTKCNPFACHTGSGPYPCEVGCQRGGYPKVGDAYESAPASGVSTVKMNKCTLCSGRAGSEAEVVAAGHSNDSLPTRANTDGSGNFISDISGLRVDELAHEPACVASCPAKAMKWDTRDNILQYLNDNYILPANHPVAPGTKNWIGGGSLYWASHQLYTLAPPKADPFIEDHVAPMVSTLFSGSGKMLLPTLVVGGLAAISARRTRNEADATTAEEV